MLGEIINPGIAYANDDSGNGRGVRSTYGWAGELGALETRQIFIKKECPIWSLPPNGVDIHVTENCDNKRINWMVPLSMGRFEDGRVGYVIGQPEEYCGNGGKEAFIDHGLGDTIKDIDISLLGGDRMCIVSGLWRER